jgi:DNA uptake protein ComE-like DNA-binding protein
MAGNFGLWTSSQRRGLAVVLAVVIAVLGIRWAFNRQIVDQPMPPQGPLADQLEDRLDPNTATAAQFGAIPDLGEKRAEAIVEYRDKWMAEHPGQKLFQRSEDLLRIKGIGVATEEMMEQYLRFPPK